MTIYDVMLDAAPNDVRLLRVLAECFEQEADSAAILNKSIEAPGGNPVSMITVDRWTLTGDFQLYASIATPISADIAKIAAYLAKTFDCRVMFADESDDPMGFLVVEPSGDTRQVVIDDTEDAQEIKIADGVGA